MAEKSYKSTILIVDDTETNIRLLAHVVKSKGYEVMAAFSGKEALTMLSRRKPDLILLDIMMPEMDGFEVCKKIKEDDNFSDIPVIFLSALSETDSKVKGFKVGGVDYITKPFQREEVLARIGLHIKLTKLQKELQQKVEELKVRENMLKKLNEEKDELMRIVSHDFRNPVTGIVGLIKVLKNTDDLSAKNTDHIFDAIQESGQKLIHLVSNLLDKNAESSITELSIEEVNFTELVAETVELHRPTAINKGIEIEKELDRISGFKLDRHKIEQVISNLISNALKFTSKGDTVSIYLEEVEKSPRKVEMTVSDSGVGMTEKQIESIWDHSKKNIREGTSGEKGSGIGLYLIKNFVDLHKGIINVESEKGKGTSFIITLTEEY